MPDSEETTHESASGWLGDVTSPYGVSDEDGTLRQAENGKWRTLFGGHKPKRFIARPAPGPRDSQVPRDTEKDVPKSLQTSAATVPVHKPGSKGSLSSMIMGQTVLAMAMLLGAVYVSRSHLQVATQLRSFLKSVYQEDYSQAVIPTIEGMIHQLHLSVNHSSKTVSSTTTLGANRTP